MSRDDLETQFLGLRAEYTTTVRVVGVLCERVLELTKASHVVISDAALIDGPDVTAWRDESQHSVVITVER